MAIQFLKRKKEERNFVGEAIEGQCGVSLHGKDCLAKANQRKLQEPPPSTMTPNFT